MVIRCMKNLGCRPHIHATLISIFALLATGAATAATYEFIAIGTLGGDVSVGLSINNAGHVVGYSWVAGNASQHAILWDGALTDLGTLRGRTDSMATSINNSGQIVGYSYTSGTAQNNSVLWDGHRKHNLGPDRAALAIGDSGYIAGEGIDNYAWVWDPNSLRPRRKWEQLKGTLPESGYGGANDVNEAGVVVGYSYSDICCTYSRLATRWDGKVATNLGALEGGEAQSEATAINTVGQVVGWSEVMNEELGGLISHATIWNGTVATDLGTLGNGYTSWARDINIHGQVVGRSQFEPGNPKFHAALWEGSTALDLNTFLDKAAVDAGWWLEQAMGINDNGWITGIAHNVNFQGTRAFILAPVPGPVFNVPEPSTWALVLSGLALLGTSVRSRRHGS